MDRTFLIKPMLDEQYPVVDYGKGVFLYDVDGKRYLDGASGAMNGSAGDGCREIWIRNIL